MTCILLVAAMAGLAQPAVRSGPAVLPQPDRDPLSTARKADPVLALAHGNVPEGLFLPMMADAVLRHPAVTEGRAGVEVAEATQDEASSGFFPTIDLLATSQRSFAREFGNDPDNIVERSRSIGRTDVTASVQQMLFDAGATRNRVLAAGARLRAASLQAEGAADHVALRAIAAWYDVFAYRALVSLSEAFVEGQRDLRRALEMRVEQGVSAPGDLPRVDSAIASASASLAGYRRQLANAQARFAELFGQPAPADLGRAPALGGAMTEDAAALLARETPLVGAAEAEARAARQEARAERASTLPSLAAGLDAGKYGFDDVDYDVRGRLVLRQRLFGSGDARADRARALAGAAEARVSRIRSEAEREAATAWADVEALGAQLAALEDAYIASRRSRDVLAERFRVTRGTLFDVLDAEYGYFDVAATYIRGIIELDAARYVLLSRTGRLLPTLGIDIPKPEDR